MNQTPDHDSGGPALPPADPPVAPVAPLAPLAPLRPPAVRRSLVAALGVTAVLVLAADQVSKAWAVAALTGDPAPTPVIDGWLQLRLVFNSGAAFSLATGTTWIFTIIASVVAVLILRIARRLGSRGWALALGLLLGGAVGNLVDRLARPPGVGRGHVVDFIEYLRFPFMEFPVFNVADSCIVTAAVLIALLGAREVPIDGRRQIDTADA
jgi:signal peptidase II